MLQRTLITNDARELAGCMEGLKAMPEYQNAQERLLLFSDQDDDVDHLAKRVAFIRDALPETKIIGFTMSRNGILRKFQNDFAGAVYSFILTERARIDLLHYDCTKMTAQDAGKSFRRTIRYKENVACVMLFSAGMEREIDMFLTTVARGDRFDIPILGAQSGAEHPYICGSFKGGIPDGRGIVALIFYGRGLNLYYNYDMGWTPIGKEMKITRTDGNYCAVSIDHIPAARIYHEYLGVEPDEYFVENVREFPFITHRGDRQVVRTPSGYDENGYLKFIAKVNRGDVLQLSYGNPRRLMENTRLYADSMRAFGPQVLLLLVCENRVRFLGENAASDIIAYRGVLGETAWARGFTAIMMDSKGGGIVNSAIVSIGMREGAPSREDLDRPVVIAPKKFARGATPLDHRLAMFLEKTTKELEDMAVAANAANSAKSDFLSMMSHEIRTPINAILGMNEMILRESDSESVLEYAENAHVAILSLLGIINDILDFSKIEAGKMDIVPHEYELASLINDLVNLTRIQAEDRGLLLEIKINPDIPHLLVGDEIRVKQVITNILTNAVKYTEKGTVTFSVDFRETGKDEIALEVSVRDTGIGIKDENLYKLFNAFDRLDAERTRKIEGTGLGLSITQRILHLMGSRLEVESVYGQGSTFSFSLRQKVADRGKIGEFGDALERVNERREKRERGFTAPGAKILVVDDAPMNLAVISGLLKRTKMRVDLAESGEECIEKISICMRDGALPYDLVFLDHRMPNMDGIETLHRLKEMFGKKIADIPVVSLTANAVVGAREEYLAAGFSDYLAKPVMVNELEDMLRKFLPPEKILYVVPEREKAEDALPAWIGEITAIHAEEGVKFCGGNAEFLDALRIFAASLDERAEEIERLYRAGDDENYTIKVHALKSMAKSIGATELSALAAELEQAGKNGDRDTIRAGTDALLAVCRGLSAPLARLRTQEAGDVRESGAREKRAPGEKPSLLLVDDDGDFLALLSRWLKRDYRVTAVNSGEKAIAYLETERPDLILLDYEMPAMNGAETLEKIRDNPRTADLSVVFLTGTDNRESVRAAEKLRPEGFLLKTMGKAGLLMGVAAFFD